MNFSTITTANGYELDFDNINEFSPSVKDIALGLSKICRCTGQIRKELYFSVAEHSILVTDLVAIHGGSLKDQKIALFHDATEAFMQDIPSPLKKKLPDYKEIETKLHKRIMDALFIPHEIPPLVDFWDKQSKIFEFNKTKYGFDDELIMCMDHEMAYKAFMRKYHLLFSTFGTTSLV